jgi:asparagine synthase (glutamine-hydrolysing)
LLGDFAFAFFDGAGERLFLVRDPLGQRPLFWHRGAGFVAFSSMPCGLHALPDIRRHGDEHAVARFLAFAPRRGPASYFDRIDRVEPGHIVSIDRGGARSRRYWNPEPRELRLPRFADYVEGYREQLDRAVACRLRGADKLVASHLSGGWDSSAVTATAARLLAPGGGRVAAFTSVPAPNRTAAPANRFADEGPLAGAVASLYPNVEHVQIVASDASPLEGLDEWARLFERPLFNLSNHVWLAQIRDAARARGVRILLTGEIGNWTISAGPAGLLADYLREGRWRDWGRAAAAMKRDSHARWRGILANSFGPWIPERLWSRLARLSADPGSRVRPALGRALLDLIEAESPQQDARTLDRRQSALAAFREMDFGEHRKGILGGWGLDKRDATADVRLIEFCLSLPLEMLLSGRGRRPLARAALADRLPAALLDERRKGYQGADWHESLTADLPRVRALVEAIAADPSASRVVDADALRAALACWPKQGWDTPLVIARYRNIFLQALTAGHFLIAARR